jgi:hypothetical protein
MSLPRRVGLALLALGACARAPSEARVDRASAVVSSSAQPAAPEPVQAAAWKSGWLLGTQYVYRLKLSTVLDLGGSRPFDFDLSGDLRVVPVQVTARIASLYLTIDGAHIVSRTPQSQAEFDKIAAEIAGTGCFIELENGTARALRSAPGLSAIAANVYRELGAVLQFSPGDGSTYVAEEYDTTGKYLMAYELSNGHWHRQKQRYLGILGADNALPGVSGRDVPEVVSSNGDVELAASGRPATIRSQNEVVVKDAQLSVRSRTTDSLEAVSESPAAPGFDFQGLLAKTVLTGVAQPYGAPSSVDALDDARIAGKSFATLYAEIAAVPQAPTTTAKPATPAQSTANGQAFISLAALFRRKPETVALALAKIRAGAPGADSLIDALGSSSSPIAERALVDFSSETSLDPKLRARSLRALSRVERPTDAAVSAWRTVLASKPFDQAALFSLGSYARHFRDAGQDASAAQLGQLLLERLRAARTESTLVTVLGALSNSGFAKAFDAVQPYVHHSSEAVRVAAVRSLQSMRLRAVDGVLASSISSDPSSQVRISALDAARVREPSDEVSKALSDVATSAVDPRVRYRAVELMIQWLPQWPQFHGALATVAEKDGESRVRERAKSAL